MMTEPKEDRPSATERSAFLAYFETKDLPPGPTKDYAEEFKALALRTAKMLPEGTVATQLLEQLLDLKDCAIRLLKDHNA